MSLDDALKDALVRALQSREVRDALARLTPAAAPASLDDDRAYTVAQVAQLSGYRTAAILERITSGDLPATKPRGCREWRIRRSDYLAWLGGGAENEEESQDPEAVARAMLGRG